MQKTDWDSINFCVKIDSAMEKIGKSVNSIESLVDFPIFAFALLIHICMLILATKLFYITTCLVCSTSTIIGTIGLNCAVVPLSNKQTNMNIAIYDYLVLIFVKMNYIFM